MTDEPGTWDDLCPNGAVRFYEGDDPDGFAAEMLTEFGIDVHAPVPDGANFFGDGIGWDDGDDNNRPFAGWTFWIPPGMVEAVYGSGRWPLGS